jgi:autotransporter translocation and assembly factor TamB
LDGRGLTWRADVGKLSGRLYGLDFGQQSFGTLQGTSEKIELAFDIGMYDSYLETPDPISWLRLNGTLPMDEAGAVDFGLVGTADLEQVLQLLAGFSDERPDAVLSGFSPLGVGILDLKVRGPYGGVGLGGAMQVRGGQLVPRENFPYGIDNLNVDIFFRDRGISLENLNGRMARGKLSANGEATWNYKGIDTFRIRAKLDDFNYYFIPEGLHLTGDLDAIFQTLPSGKSEIRGTLNATDMTYATEIDLWKLIMDSSVATIPSLQSIELDDPLDTIGLNLDVAMAQPWVVETNLLKFKGVPSGKLKIMGTLANPGLRGRMEFIPGGRISNILPAGDVIIEKGSIDFPDPSVFNPVIDLQGQIDVSPYRVNINVQGALDTISMVPTSTPSLRQDEVISILLNPALAPQIDRSASGSLSSSDSTSSWVSAAGGLVTNLGLASIQERFRRALKLDRVSAAFRPGMGSDTTAETDVIIGKNLTFGEKTVPVIGSFRTSGNVTTVGGEIEWRIGDLVFRLGASGDGANISPSGEVRYSWSLW